MILSKNIFFILFSIILLYLSHLYSQSLNLIQITIHLISLVFIYIVAFRQVKIKNKCIEPENQTDHNIKKCLKTNVSKRLQ